MSFWTSASDRPISSTSFTCGTESRPPGATMKRRPSLKGFVVTSSTAFGSTTSISTSSPCASR